MDNSNSPQGVHSTAIQSATSYTYEESETNQSASELDSDDEGSCESWITFRDEDEGAAGESDSENSENSPPGGEITSNHAGIIDVFSHCRGAGKHKKPMAPKLKTYALAELQKYAKADIKWLERISLAKLLRCFAQREGKLVQSWRNFLFYNFIHDYCSKMTASAALRELLQNWRDGILQTYNLKSDEVEVDKSVSGRRNTNTTYLAFRKGGRQVLGSICCKSGLVPTVEITNIGVALPRKVLMMGYSSKPDSHLPLIGQYGEGMKVAILALLRAGKKVEYVTNGERWDGMLWSYHAKEEKKLAIKFVKIPKASTAQKANTKVTVFNVTAEDLCASNFLFLQSPPLDSTYKTDHGSILTDPNYVGKVFVRGIFVEERTSAGYALTYGLDFYSAKLADIGRDRDKLPINYRTVREIYKIWESAILNSEKVASLYLRLLQKDTNCLDVLNAEEHVTSEVAKMLFTILQAETTVNTAFYYLPQGDMSKDLQIITKVLGMTPYQISGMLHKIFTKFSLISSPNEAQQELFRHCSTSNLGVNPAKWSNWLRHTLHCFYALLDLLNIPRDSIEFIVVPPALAMDFIKVDSATSKTILKINDRILSPSHIHETNSLCFATGESPIDEACDCGIRRLFEIIINEIAPQKDEKRSLAVRFGELDILLNTMPRDVKIEPSQDDPEAPVLSWDVNLNDRHLQGFEIIVWPNTISGAINPLLHTESNTVFQTTAEDGSEAIFLGTEGNVKRIILKDLIPGIKYTVMIRAKAWKTAIFSVPLNFETPITSNISGPTSQPQGVVSESPELTGYNPDPCDESSQEKLASRPQDANSISSHDGNSDTQTEEEWESDYATDIDPDSEEEDIPLDSVVLTRQRTTQRDRYREIHFSSIDIYGRCVQLGRYYDIVECNGKRSTILVHRIVQINTATKSRILLKISKFCNGFDIALLNGKAPSKLLDLLFLSYSDWTCAGQEEDAEDLKVENIREIVTESYVSCRLCKGASTESDVDGPSQRREVLWAFTAENNQATFRRITENADDQERVEISGPPSLVDLFCGMGCFSRGFADAGYRIVAGVDNNWYAASTFKNQHPSSQIYVEDIRAFLNDYMEGKLLSHGLDKPTVLLIAPPCKGLSKANSGGKEDGKNNALSDTVPLAVKVFQPSFVVFENVRELLREKVRPHLSNILVGIMELGYSFQMKILDAADYGVPQHRSRLFLIASKSGILPGWPEATHSKGSYVTMRDAISDLNFKNHRKGGTVSRYPDYSPRSVYAAKMRERLGRRDSKLLFNHSSQKDPGLNATHRILDWDEPARTILATRKSRNSCLHPDSESYLTARESCRSMGITDDIHVLGPMGEQFKQIGNGVCPLLANVIGELLHVQCIRVVPDDATKLSKQLKRGREEWDFVLTLEGAKKIRLRSESVFSDDEVQ